MGIFYSLPQRWSATLPACESTRLTKFELVKPTNYSHKHSTLLTLSALLFRRILSYIIGHCRRNFMRAFYFLFEENEICWKKSVIFPNILFLFSPDCMNELLLHSFCLFWEACNCSNAQNAHLQIQSFSDYVVSFIAQELQINVFVCVKLCA